MGQTIINTSCPRDCFSACDIKAYVEDGKIVKIEGGSKNRATNSKLCIKGLSYTDYVYSPQRIGYPMIREGKRGEGIFKRISWETAIDEISKRLKLVKDTVGPLGLLHFTSAGCMGLMSEYYKGFFNQFGSYSATKGSLCYSAGIEAVKLTYGSNIQNAPWDLEHAGLIIIWGKNPSSTNVQELKFINEAVNKGAKIITIDPINTLPSLNSNLHIPIKPGTDGVLALCIANLLIQKGSIDIDFIKEYTFGFDEFKEHVSHYTIEYASKICGLNEDLINEAVNLIANKKPMTLICGYGMQRYKNGGQNVRAISMIPALTGDIGIRGGGFKFANKRWRNLEWPYIPQNDIKTRRDFAEAQLGRAIEEYQNPNIKLLWIERANPLTMNPDTNGLKRALKKVEYIVAIDLFMTDTAKYADIILPAQSFFEYEDVFSSYWTPYLNCFQKVIEPVNESKNESEIYRLLGKKMGYNMNYLPLYNEETIDVCLKKCNINVSVKDLKKGPYLKENSDIAYKERIFDTPSKKIEFYCERMESIWGKSPLPDFKDCFKGTEENGKYPLRLLSTHARERIHSQFGEIRASKLSSDKPLLYINKEDARMRNIKDGDKIEIYNEKGKIFAFAKIDPYIIEGVVNIHGGLKEDTAANVNILTDQDISDIAFGAVFYDCFVEASWYQNK
ncbi:putative dimethyl sulfoxide reductase chain YnfF precursor [Oxobacter pfennigii]|uniref:Putative dimethyl sulfoxide reductase chain YnfF n=1 Tax=Oxobacter pfennigii TaxID=36849 RepID=A0A0P8W931_9CLOT|nr:molybdopterin-dependent oxidoreductase [Oxobacter pfennigii]KPU44214.1 putative dimethyl sulfoxide reductase chain YnfF precursor [Oxobacter pfennigii]